MPEVSSYLPYSRLESALITTFRKRAHWPVHKAICKLNQKTKATSSLHTTIVPKGGVATYISPSQNPGKLMEDLGRWVKVRVQPALPNNSVNLGLLEA
jgi:hypothetical protein